MREREDASGVHGPGQGKGRPVASASASHPLPCPSPLPLHSSMPPCRQLNAAMQSRLGQRSTVDAEMPYRIASADSNIVSNPDDEFRGMAHGSDRISQASSVCKCAGPNRDIHMRTSAIPCTRGHSHQLTRQWAHVARCTLHTGYAGAGRREPINSACRSPTPPLALEPDRHQAVRNASGRRGMGR
jgi:hypothetical protein